MTTNIPQGVPGQIFDSAKIADGFARKSINPEDVRNDPIVNEALQNGQIDKEFLRGPAGIGLYSAHTQPSEDSSNIAFERNFSPYLARDSDYYGNVKGML